ncbi:MAG TPA: AI-2E family transporter [Gemmatimonadaceae bacterium]|nr:AI-2E family transporter [Gemmatimonadaceae bacterium]
MATETRDWKERRRTERRLNHRLADLTLPELRRMLVTTTIFIIVTVLFLWMVRTVIIATILGIVVAVYMRPVYTRLEPRLGRTAAATITIFGIIIPVLALLVYSYVEIKDVAEYVAANQDAIAAKIDLAIRKLPFMGSADTGGTIRNYVIAASNYGTRIPGLVRKALSGFAISATIFVFTAFYVLVEAKEISTYFRSKVPPRYSELQAALESNVRGVLYGAVYSTFVTQTLKSAILLVLFLLFQVPLAAVLSILSFIIGFFPIVGSWSVYVPVALWLLVFRDAPAQAALLVAIGFVVNTIYISTFLRPKIAAEKSKVLNFYWMLVGLITGVYTFGLVGVLLGPIVIGLLKAIVDTVSASTWRLLDDEEAQAPAAEPSA